MIKKKTAREKGGFREIWETVKTLFWAGLIAVVIRSLAVEPFNIPSGSMIPTLLVGDYLFVTKYSYGYSRYSFPWGSALPFFGRIGSHLPERGDVVVFRPYGDPKTDFIKRVIGLPGDTIQMKQGVLYINGKQVERKRIEDYIDPDNPIAAPIAQYVETLPNGVQHRTLEASGDEGYLDNTPVYKVPAGHYFMMGDNRDNSNDSRAPRFGFGDLSPESVIDNNELLFPVGFVPAENLVGPAQFLFWSYGPGFTYYNPVTWVSELRWRRLLDLIR